MTGEKVNDADSKQGRSDLLDIAAILIAALAVSMSAWVAWDTHLSPPKIRGYSNEVWFIRVGDDARPVIPILFVNNGSQGALIEDVCGAYIKDQNQTLFVPIGLVDPMEWGRASQTGLSEPELIEPWQSFYLGGKQQKLVNVLFDPPQENYPNFDQAFKFSVGPFRLRILIYHDGKWVTGPTIDLPLGENVMAQIGKARSVALQDASRRDNLTPSDFDPSGTR